MRTCENCEKEHDGEYGSGRFCSVKCSRGFATKAKRKEINEKVSQSLSGITHSEKRKKKTSKHWKKYWSVPRKEHREKIKKSLSGKARPISKRNSINLESICKVCNTSGKVKYYCQICESCKEAYYVHYRSSIHFQFNVYDYPKHFDLTLLEKYGWYNPKTNKNGISRDHIISAKDGFSNNIPIEYMKHPANCKLVRHIENQRKRTKSNMTYLELVERIEKFNTRL